MKTSRIAPYVGDGPTYAWAEIPFPGDNTWTLAVRLISQNGRVVVSELRVFPDMAPPGDAQRYPAHWAGAPSVPSGYQGIGGNAPVPPGGLTARMLRNVRLGDALAAGQDLAEHWQTHKAETYMGSDDNRDLIASTVAGGLARRRSRAATITDQELAQLAADYVRLVNDPATRHAPVKALAEHLGEKRDRVRDHIHAARERRLLTGGTHGVPGGQLTRKGQRLL